MCIRDRDVGDNNGFSLITDYDGNDEQAFEVNVKSGEILPVLPLRNMAVSYTHLDVYKRQIKGCSVIITLGSG